MQKRKKTNYWVHNDQHFLQLIETADRRTLNSTYQGRNIPKIAHFIWLGPKSLPKYADNCMRSFAAQHPDWQCRLWRDSDVATLIDFQNLDYFQHHLFNFGLKSDLLRYEILRRYGGVYIDLDYEFVRSLDNLLDRCDFFCGLSNTAACEVNNGIIGCTPGHSWVEEVSKETRRRITAFMAKDITPSLPNEVIMSFLSQQEREKLLEVAKEKLLFHTISLTGPGMLTSFLYDSLQNSTTETLEIRPLVLPVEAFSAVPNLSRVSLSTLPDASQIGVSQLPRISEEKWREALLEYNYVDREESEWKEGEINWRDYEEVKGTFVRSESQFSCLITAIHWWQRSWQVPKDS